MEKLIGSLVIGFLSGILITLVLLNSLTEQTRYYRQGQIDCINGRVTYELKVQPDRTTAWDKK